MKYLSEVFFAVFCLKAFIAAVMVALVIGAPSVAKAQDANELARQQMLKPADWKFLVLLQFCTTGDSIINFSLERIISEGFREPILMVFLNG